MVMAVERMEHISVTGPLKLFDDFVLKHIINNSVQLESAYKFFDINGLIPFEEDTSLDNLRKRMHSLNEKFGIKIKKYDRKTIEKEFRQPVDMQVAGAFTRGLENRLSGHRKKIEDLRAAIEERKQIMKQTAPLVGMDIDLDELSGFRFIEVRFGFIPKENFNKKRSWLEELDVVIVRISEENDNIWLSYFMPFSAADVIDSVFSALGFVRVKIPDHIGGKPGDAMSRLNHEVEELKKEIGREENELEQFFRNNKEEFSGYYHKVLYLSKVNEVKKLSCHNRETFFLAGWIPYGAYRKLRSELEGAKDIVLSWEEPEYVMKSSPPTIMKNARFLKPFESMVSMYGLPSSGEIDPTLLFAITYVLMFGFMFGDVGQGLVIALAGLYLYRKKGSGLGGVMTYAGISSALFGFVYGSVFGSEDIIEPLWLSPLHSRDTINTLLYIAVGYGVFINITAIIASMVNSIRMHQWGKLLFDKNGLAGLLFYGGIAVIAAVWLITGKLYFGALSIAVVIVLPAVMIFFREPLGNLIQRKSRIFPEQKGMYVIESFFELFETVLSFFSGTVSFARVGAFALNHAGLSLAVWTLYHMASGIGGIVVVILGNLLTIGLEGLIVGIQCMRLEYYEIFGRFYIGDGREFKTVEVTED